MLKCGINRQIAMQKPGFLNSRKFPDKGKAESKNKGTGTSPLGAVLLDLEGAGCVLKDKSAIKSFPFIALGKNIFVINNLEGMHEGVRHLELAIGTLGHMAIFYQGKPPGLDELYGALRRQDFSLKEASSFTINVTLEGQDWAKGYRAFLEQEKLQRAAPLNLERKKSNRSEVRKI